MPRPAAGGSRRVRSLPQGGRGPAAVTPNSRVRGGGRPAAPGAALAGPGTVQDRLSAAFAAKIGPEMAQALNSPHGAELIDIHASLAQDIVSEGAGRMVQVLADWLTEEARAGRITLTAPPAEVAALILRLLESLKNQGFDDFVVARDRLARLLAGGLVAGTV